MKTLIGISVTLLLIFALLSAAYAAVSSGSLFEYTQQGYSYAQEQINK